MRGIVFSLLAMTVGIAGVSRAADPYELNPHPAEVVVEAAWGESVHEFAPHCDTWGTTEVGGFGAFNLDEDGRIYIADEGSNTVKVFAADGVFLRSVPLQVERNLVDDLIVREGVIYWLREWPGRPTNIYSVAPGADEAEVFRVAVDPDLKLDHQGRPYVGNLSFAAYPEGVGLYARMLSFFVPVTRNDKPLTKVEQAAAKQRGLPDGDTRIAQIFYPATTTAGKEVEPTDVVRLNQAGEITGILAPRPGHLLGPSNGRFLTARLNKTEGEWGGYWVLHDAGGHELSRTLMPRRPDGLNIQINNTVRLASDGSFFELVVDRDCVQVVKYARTEGGQQ